MEKHTLEFSINEIDEGEWEEVWFCPECGRTQVFTPYNNEWTTTYKGNMEVKHFGLVGLSSFGGEAQQSVPDSFEVFLNGIT